MARLDVFGGVMYLLFFAPFLFPLAPWFAKSRAAPGESVTEPLPYLSSFSQPFFGGGVIGQTAAKEPLQFSSSLQFGCSLPWSRRFPPGRRRTNLHACRHPTRPGPFPDRPPVGGFGVSAADLGFIGRRSRSR